EVEHRAAGSARLKRVNARADRANGLDEAPERAEQAEENEQAGHVAGYVAGLVKAGSDRIEDTAHQLRRHSHAPDAASKNCGHRCEKNRNSLDSKARGRKAEVIDPSEFRIHTQQVSRR